MTAALKNPGKSVAGRVEASVAILAKQYPRSGEIGCTSDKSAGPKGPRSAFSEMPSIGIRLRRQCCEHSSEPTAALFSPPLYAAGRCIWMECARAVISLRRSPCFVNGFYVGDLFEDRGRGNPRAPPPLSVGIPLPDQALAPVIISNHNRAVRQGHD